VDEGKPLEKASPNAVVEKPKGDIGCALLPLFPFLFFSRKDPDTSLGKGSVPTFFHKS